MSDIEGTIILSLFAAGVLTLIFGAIALLLLQRAIVRNMRASSGQPPAAAAERPRWAATAPLAFAVDAAAPAGRGLADRILRRITAAHIVAGLAFAILATLAYLGLKGMEFLPLRTAVLVWAYGWPTVLVLSLLAGPDRRVQGLILLVYFGGILGFCIVAALVGTQPLDLAGVTVPGFFQPLTLWMIYAVPSLFLLLFLNRTIRTIGPLVLVFVFVILVGGNLALSLLAVPAVFDSFPIFFMTMALGGDGAFWTIAALGALVAVWPAWLCVKLVSDRYAAKRSSDLMLTIAAVWALEALSIASSLAYDAGIAGVAVALGPIVAWRLTLYVALRPVVSDARSRPPSRLLLLRVFGFGRRSRRLLDLFSARWRLIGSIDLIAAPDLASRTIEPSTFLAFIRGRLARLFLRTPGELDDRLAALDHQPDPDARFRINQLFCSEDMWRDAVARLMGEASLVVMDLRGFGAHHRGCVYELQTLLDTVPIERLAFLFDQTTDRRALETLLTEHWQRLDAASPNVTTRNATLRLLDASGSDTVVVHRLLAIGEAAARVQ
jgi:hypothetical protein